MFDRLSVNKKYVQEVLTQLKTDFELQECTFKPSIPPSSEKLHSTHRSAEPIHVRLNAEAEALKKAQQKREEAQLAAERLVATFQPQLEATASYRSSTPQKASKPIHERLDAEAKRRRAEVEKRVAQKQKDDEKTVASLPFAPEIIPRSRVLAERRSSRMLGAEDSNEVVDDEQDSDYEGEVAEVHLDGLVSTSSPDKSAVSSPSKSHVSQSRQASTNSMSVSYLGSTKAFEASVVPKSLKGSPSPADMAVKSPQKRGSSATPTTKKAGLTSTPRSELTIVKDKSLTPVSAVSVKPKPTSETKAPKSVARTPVSASKPTNNVKSSAKKPLNAKTPSTAVDPEKIVGGIRGGKKVAAPEEQIEEVKLVDEVENAVQPAAASLIEEEPPVDADQAVNEEDDELTIEQEQQVDLDLAGIISQTTIAPQDVIVDPEPAFQTVEELALAAPKPETQILEPEDEGANIDVGRATGVELTQPLDEPSVDAGVPETTEEPISAVVEEASAPSEIESESKETSPALITTTSPAISIDFQGGKTLRGGKKAKPVEVEPSVEPSLS